MFSFMRCWPGFPPAFASLMPLVSGLLPPIEIRPEVGADVPERTPGAITRTFSGPNGSHFGSHSSSRIRADKARPPKIFQSAENGSNDVVCVVMSTRRIRSPLDSGIKAPPIRESHYANLLPRGSTRPNEAPVGVTGEHVSCPHPCRAALAPAALRLADP